MAAGDLTLFDEALAYLIDGGFESADSIALALITTAVTPTASAAVPSMGGGTTVFTEVTPGGNYTAGGITLDTLGNCVTESGGAVTFNDTGSNVSWSRHASNPTDARYAILYNNTDTTNRAVGFIDLGATVDLSAGDLTLTWESTGIFRIDGVYDSFDGSGALDSGLWDEYEPDDTSADLTITQTGGKYSADVAAGDAATTEWFNGDEGLLHYKTFTGDFEFIARNMGLAASPTPDENDYQFCGVLCWLSANNWEFAVPGNRGGTGNTVEYKVTISSSSNQNDTGQDSIWSYKADLRITRVGSAVNFYYAEPGTDNWIAPGDSGGLDHDGLSGGRVSFGTGAVRVGLITYGFGTVAAYTGECDQVEIPTGTPS